jgi:hypothetical protein
MFNEIKPNNIGKNARFVKKYFLPLMLMAFLTFFAGCQDDASVLSTDQMTTDKQALEKIADQDSVLASFDTNYNEEGEMDVLSKVSTEIKPFQVGQKMRLVNKTLTVNFVGDTAYGLITKSFEGVLYIRGSYDLNAAVPETLITKAFSTVVTRKIMFIKVANTDIPENNWRIAAISLPQGGTLTQGIDITKFTAFLPDGDTLVINSPNDYYLVRNWGFWWRWHHVPAINFGQDVLLRVELNSNYADDDFVTVTFGADKFGMYRTKKEFILVSSTQNGNTYSKVYEQTFSSHRFPGFYHAIINAMPKQVVNDDAAPVEIESWGIPYYIKIDLPF